LLADFASSSLVFGSASLWLNYRFA